MTNNLKVRKFLRGFRSYTMLNCSALTGRNSYIGTTLTVVCISTLKKKKNDLPCLASCQNL